MKFPLYGNQGGSVKMAILIHLEVNFGHFVDLVYETRLIGRKLGCN